MGVQGAAIATVLSQMVSALWVLRFLTGKTTTLHLRPAGDAAEVIKGKKYHGAGSDRFYDAVYQQCGADRLQFHAANLGRRPVRGRG